MTFNYLTNFLSTSVRPIKVNIGDIGDIGDIVDNLYIGGLFITTIAVGGIFAGILIPRRKSQREPVTIQPSLLFTRVNIIVLL